jgi:LacI family transcriptional regulator
MINRLRIAVMLELEWPYSWHHDIFAGIQSYGDARGTWMTIIDEHVTETLTAGGGGERPYDGIIARATTRLAGAAQRAGIPLVNVWTDSPARDVPSVFADFEGIGRLAAQHLLDRGLRQFACLAVPRHRATGLLAQGFHEVVARAGSRCCCCHVRQKHSGTAAAWQETSLAIDRWIDDWLTPTGVFVTLPDAIARQVAGGCVRRGMRIPEDVAIVASIDDPPRTTTPAPALTGVAMPFNEVGRRAAELLEHLIQRRSAVPKRILVPPHGVVPRESTARADDTTVARAERFIAEAAHREIDVGDIAAAAATTRRTLERRFRKARGHTVADTLRTIRIERAQRLLLDTGLPIKQIALECGFGCSVRMSEVFRRQLGCSPSEYRKSR